MPTNQELKIKADALRKADKHDEAIPFYEEIWKSEKNDWNGYFLAQCFRKEEKYNQAREIQNEVIRLFPNFSPIRNEVLWLDYNEKLKNYQNQNYLQDAQSILAKSKQDDQYLGGLFTKTILAVVKRLLLEDKNDNALIWLDKLDFFLLPNSTFKYKEQYYPSDKKTYFILYADSLIKSNKHLSYIEDTLKSLNFSDAKLAAFRSYIINNITYGDYISRIRLALYIKYFKEEQRLRKKNAIDFNYNSSKITLISDLSNFEFCPVSFAINESFKIPDNETWQKDEWIGEKKHLYHRFNIFNRTKNIKTAFDDTMIEVNDSLQNQFLPIFNSELISNNYDGISNAYSTNPSNTIKGIPDYVFRDRRTNQKYVVVEKFTKNNADHSNTAYNNDLIKVYAYINELKSLNLDYGFLIYWYWDLFDLQLDSGKIQKKINIKSYKIFEIKNTPSEKEKLSKTIEFVQFFKAKKQYIVEGDKISYPNKCLNCSAVSHCNHKTGKFNIVNLPYRLNESDTGINYKVNTIEPLDDDLPF